MSFFIHYFNKTNWKRTQIDDHLLVLSVYLHDKEIFFSFLFLQIRRHWNIIGVQWFIQVIVFWHWIRCVIVIFWRVERLSICVIPCLNINLIRKVHQLCICLSITCNGLPSVGLEFLHLWSSSLYLNWHWYDRFTSNQSGPGWNQQKLNLAKHMSLFTNLR